MLAIANAKPAIISERDCAATADDERRNHAILVVASGVVIKWPAISPSRNGAQFVAGRPYISQMPAYTRFTVSGSSYGKEMN